MRAAHLSIRTGSVLPSRFFFARITVTAVASWGDWVRFAEVIDYFNFIV